MKYFIGADIEIPHLSFYAVIDNDPHFFGRWTWADENGLPDIDQHCMYFNTREDAQEVVDNMRITGAGIKYHADTIQVVELDI
jgi:hypothetical protein